VSRSLDFKACGRDGKKKRDGRDLVPEGKRAEGSRGFYSGGGEKGEGSKEAPILI